MPKKSNGAVVGFWLVQGASEEVPIIVCPTLIRNKAVKKIEEVKMQEAWNVKIQIPIDAKPDAVITMIPEISNLTALEVPIETFASLWDVRSIKAKCEELTAKYGKQLANT